MPPIVHEEMTQVLEMDEHLGVVMSARLKYFVTGMESTDYTILFDVLTQAGIPDYGMPLDADKGMNTILVNRGVKVTEDDPGSATIMCFFDHVLNGPYQNLRTGNPHFNNMVVGKFKTSLVEETTNRSSWNNPIPVTVQHRYPQTDRQRSNQLEIQGGEFRVLVPRTTFTVAGFMDMYPPHLTPGPDATSNGIFNFRQLRDNIVGCVNEDNFLGRWPRKWLCTDCQGELLALLSPSEEDWDGVPLSRYRLSLEFELDGDSEGHDPTVMFIDRRTNRPPPGLVAGVGYKTVEYYRANNFGHFFGAGVAKVDGNESASG